jgi:hypothetical protein
MFATSKEWKRARQDAGKIVNIAGDLRVLQIDLTMAPIKRRMAAQNQNGILSK